VAKLTAANEVLTTRLAQAEATAAAAKAEARAAAESFAKNSVPSAELEAARRALAAAQDQLASTTKELSTVRAQVVSGRELDARLQQLEIEKEALTRRLSAPGPTKEELAAAVSAKEDAEEKLSFSLRSYSVITKERDELAAKLASLPPATPPTGTNAAELESLRTRAAAAERKLADTQEELARLNHGVATNIRPTPTVAASAAGTPRDAAASTASGEPVRPTAPSATAGSSAPTLSAPARPGSASGNSQSATAASPLPATKTEAPAKNSNPRFHTVAIGDTLSKISLQYYGTTARWTDILAANRDLLRDERSLVAGRILRIP
jgi:nucleoid-associated protein YgaU